MRSMLLKPISFLYAMVTSCRNWLYDQELFDAIRLAPPTKVISVGNLSLGGTGKTPFVDLILKRALAHGQRTGLVARNYKAQCVGSHELQLTRSNGAAYFGDEPWMLAQKNPGVHVQVGPLKWQSALELRQNYELDVLLLDDGFQHRQLARDLDVVLIDATKGPESLESFPGGGGRESLASLERASLVVLNKVNLAEPAILAEWRKYFSNYSELIESEQELDFEGLNLGDRRVFAFSGVAHPAQFEQALRNRLNERVLGFVSYPDHYAYEKNDLLNLLQKAKEKDPAAVLLTTEKDFVKVKALQGQVLIDLEILAVPAKLRFVKGEEKFYATVDSVLC